MCTSPVHYSGLLNGRHRFHVFATVGSRTDAAMHEWVVDRDLADAVLTSKPPKSSTSSQAQFAWEGSEAATTFSCRLDGGPAAPCTSPHTYSGLADGEHTLTVTALAGTVPDETPAAFTWQVDTRAPDTQLTRNNTFSVNSTGATFNIARTFASGDPGFVGTLRLPARRRRVGAVRVSEDLPAPAGRAPHPQRAGHGRGRQRRPDAGHGRVEHRPRAGVRQLARHGLAGDQRRRRGARHPPGRHRRLVRRR